jgi:hypothetical protein
MLDKQGGIQYPVYSVVIDSSPSPDTIPCVPFSYLVIRLRNTRAQFTESPNMEGAPPYRSRLFRSRTPTRLPLPFHCSPFFVFGNFNFNIAKSNGLSFNKTRLNTSRQSKATIHTTKRSASGSPHHSSFHPSRHLLHCPTLRHSL